MMLHMQRAPLHGALAPFSARRIAPVGVALAALLGVAACGSLPRSGPTVSAVEKEARSPTGFPFRLIKYDLAASNTLTAHGNPLLSTDGFFKDTGSSSGGSLLGPGDVLSITVLEPASGGLFGGISSSGTGGQGSMIVTLPDSQVDRSGKISFPFVGEVSVTGKTTRQLALALEDGLRDKVIQPQVIVRLVSNMSSKVMVAGAVRAPGEFDLTPAGETVIRLISRAGGPVAPTSDTIVEMTRNRVTKTVPLQALISRPSADVRLRAGDFINVSAVPRTYLIAGAAGTTREAPLPPEPLSLASALARAGGLDDRRADPQGVFVLRYESKRIADTLSPPDNNPSDFVPVVYQIDMRTAGGYFLADRFVLREKDIVFLSNAPFVEAQKVFGLFSSTVAPVATTAAVATRF